MRSAGCSKVRIGESLATSKLILAAHILVGSSLSEVARFTGPESCHADSSVDGKCADTIRHIAWLAGLNLGLSTVASCPDREAVQRHRVTIHPGNPNSFQGAAVERSEVRCGDLILFQDTDPRYAGTGLVTHVGLVVDVGERLMVDASYQEKIVCYRPWETFTSEQTLGFWRLDALEVSGRGEGRCARATFGDYGRRRSALERIDDAFRRQTLQAWNNHLRQRELEGLLEIEGQSEPLRELLMLERERLRELDSKEPTGAELGPILAPEINRALSPAGQVMKTLSHFLSRLGWHRIARVWRRRLRLFNRAQSSLSTPRAWREPVGYRDYNNRIHRRWLERFWGDCVFRRVLKTDLHDESISQGLVESLLLKSRIVYGIDIDPAVQGAAQARFPDLETLVCDVRGLPFPDGFLHLVVSNSTLDHFPNPQGIDSALKEISRVTEPGGYLAITLDNPDNPVLAVRKKVPEHSLLTKLGLAPYYRGTTLSLEELCEKLEELGYRVLDRDFLFHAPRLFLVHGVSRLGFQDTAYAKALQWESRVPQALKRRTGYFVAVIARKREDC